MKFSITTEALPGGEVLYIVKNEAGEVINQKQGPAFEYVAATVAVDKGKNPGRPAVVAWATSPEKAIRELDTLNVLAVVEWHKTAERDTVANSTVHFVEYLASLGFKPTANSHAREMRKEYALFDHKARKLCLVNLDADDETATQPDFVTLTGFKAGKMDWTATLGAGIPLDGMQSLMDALGFHNQQTIETPEGPAVLATLTVTQNFRPTLCKGEKWDVLRVKDTGIYHSFLMRRQKDGKTASISRDVLRLNFRAARFLQSPASQPTA